MLTTYQLNDLTSEFLDADRVAWNALLDGTPISITMLFRLRYPDRIGEEIDLRRKQQTLGPCFARMNAILRPRGIEIRIGGPRHTYQLLDVAA